MIGIVRPACQGRNYSEHITHCNVQRTIEDAFGPPCVAISCSATPITDTWQ